MVRDAARRISKYTAKMVGDVVKNRIDAQKDSMVEQVTDQFALLASMETTVNSMLDAAGTQAIQKPFYLSFARKLYGIKRKHNGATALLEAEIACDAWTARGLSQAMLHNIAEDVFELDVCADTS